MSTVDVARGTNVPPPAAPMDRWARMHAALAAEKILAAVEGAERELARVHTDEQLDRATTRALAEVQRALHRGHVATDSLKALLAYRT